MKKFKKLEDEFPELPKEKEARYQENLDYQHMIHKLFHPQNLWLISLMLLQKKQKLLSFIKLVNR